GRARIEHNESGVRREPGTRPVGRRPVADGAVASLPAADYPDCPFDLAARIDTERRIETLGLQAIESDDGQGCTDHLLRALVRIHAERPIHSANRREGRHADAHTEPG